MEGLLKSGAAPPDRLRHVRWGLCDGGGCWSCVADRRKRGRAGVAGRCDRRHLVIDEADQRRVFELATVPLLQQPQLTALTAIARMRWNMCGCVQHSGVRVGPDQRYRRVVAE